jgi:hypothetical protein
MERNMASIDAIRHDMHVVNNAMLDLLSGLVEHLKQSQLPLSRKKRMTELVENQFQRLEWIRRHVESYCTNVEAAERHQLG